MLQVAHGIKLAVACTPSFLGKYPVLLVMYLTYSQHTTRVEISILILFHFSTWHRMFCCQAPLSCPSCLTFWIDSSDCSVFNRQQPWRTQNHDCNWCPDLFRDWFDHTIFLRIKSAILASQCFTSWSTLLVWQCCSRDRDKDMWEKKSFGYSMKVHFTRRERSSKTQTLRCQHCRVPTVRSLREMWMPKHHCLCTHHYIFIACAQ